MIPSKYQHKVATAEEAVKVIKSGDNVYLHANSGFPLALVEAMCNRYKELHNVNVYHLTTFHKARYAEPDMAGHFNHVALFIAGNVRKAVNEGRADFVPVFLSEIENLFITRRIDLDVAMVHLSPPDEHGFCSYGVSNDISKTAAENSKVIIAQINPRMPRVYGDNFIHISKLDYIVEVDLPLDEVPMVDDNITESEKALYSKIASYISEMVEDGSTMQMGIGAIPDAVLNFLKDKKDLGIHTEMFSDGLIGLIESGVVNCEKKTFLPGKIVASFVIATKKCFDFMDNNPFIEFRPSRFVNDPFNIAKNDKMISINSSLQIDFTGQACSDSIGHKFYSGFGGQVDFIRGASRSKGGKAILALPATAKNGQISRIVHTLNPGAGVTTSKADIHYVATEYGVADLHGKTIRQRVKAMIDIAHPNFKEELEKKAFELKYLW
ncbi:MAG: acetyl-CoA hydrolase/transferase family protein [Ignavibacteria bacterium]|nr:acetyl-CoA hydrolase/transferase family protein [Ignavibacteria bacterium]